MTRWGVVSVAVLAVACGGKKEEDKPSEATKGAGDPRPRAAAVKRGGDDAACTKLIENVAEIYRAWNADHAYGMMPDDKDGEHYQRVWRICTKWSTEEDRACVIAARDYDELEQCTGLDARRLDEARDIPACDGGVVSRLSCPDGAWKNDRACVPAPAGFVVKGDARTDSVELGYADGSTIRLHWEDGSDCKDVRDVIAIKYMSDELFDECRWPHGSYAAVDPFGDQPRMGIARLCARTADGATEVTCRVKDAPRLEGVCRAIQFLGDPGAAFDLGGGGDKAAEPTSRP